jgi:hypothetical protein
MREIERSGIELGSPGTTEGQVPGKREDRHEGECHDEGKGDLGQALQPGLDGGEGIAKTRLKLGDRRRAIADSNDWCNWPHIPHHDELGIDDIGAKGAMRAAIQLPSRTIRRQKVRLGSGSLRLGTECTHGSDLSHSQNRGLRNSAVETNPLQT